MSVANQIPQDNEFLERLKQIVLENLNNEQFGVTQLAREFGVSRSHLHRKLTMIKGQSISQFIREVRLTEAYKLLKNDALSASEVTYKVGFNNPSYFNSCFHEYFGYPPGEVKNQESENKTDFEIKEKPQKGWLRNRIIQIAIALFLIIAFALSFSLFKKATSKEIEKSIAVLPFSDDSPEKNYSFLIDGLLEEILYKLSLVSDLRVVSRTSVEKYRSNEKSIKEIGKELNVDYILEGSAQTINNVTRVRMQLIKSDSDKHLWSKPYEREITLDNIFDVQNELAEQVIDELGTFLSREEKKQLVKKPTENLAAYNKYLWGLDYLRLFEQRPIKKSFEELPKAKQLFEQAIQLDSTFTEAYLQLGNIYLNKMESWGNIYILSNYLDSARMMIDKALQYDENNWKAMALKGQYYLKSGSFDKANAIFEKLPEDVSEVQEYYKAAFNHFFMLDDAYNTIRNYLKYEELIPSGTLINPLMYIRIVWHFTYTGYPEMAKRYAEKILHRNNDPIAYFNLMSTIETMSGNYNAAIKYSLNTLKMDSTNIQSLYFLMVNSIWLKDYKNAYTYLVKYGGRYINGQSAMMIGFVYLKNGMKEEADKHFKKAIKIINDEINLNTFYGHHYYSQSYLACVYAAMGDKDKAFEYLDLQKKRETIHLLMIISMKEWPMLENIRQAPEFANILVEMENKYNKEHEHVGELLREKGMLE